jgi:undecaprenyl-diphosphatase
MPLRWLHRLSYLIAHAWREVIGPKLAPLVSAIGVIGLAIAAISLWGFAQIADEVLEKETQGFDTAILLFLRKLHTPLLDQVMIGITVLGEPTILVGITLVLSLVVLIRRQFAVGIVFAIAALGAAGLNVLLKDVFARARPALWERSVDVRFYSFPSGHAMVSLVIYGLIGYLLANHYKHRSRLILSLAALLVVLIGFSRLYLGVHWPTDVIAGYAAGLVWLIACILSLDILQRRPTR